MTAPSALVVPFLRAPIFQGLSPGRLEAIARASERVTRQAGETVVAAGAAADAAYLIVSGRAELRRGTGPEATRSMLAAGALIGEIAMLVETTYGATVVALEPMRLLRIGRGALLAILQADPGLARHFLAKVNERLLVLASEVRRISASLAEPEPAARSASRRVFPEPRPELPKGTA